MRVLVVGSNHHLDDPSKISVFEDVRGRAPQHATARFDLGEAAPQRRCFHALPARALTRRCAMPPGNALRSGVPPLLGLPVSAGVENVESLSSLRTQRELETRFR